MSDDPDSFTHPPILGSRRVSVFVALPVIVGCAVLGSIAGVTLPLRSFFQGESRGEEVADLRLASLKLVETPPGEGLRRPGIELSEKPAAVTAATVASQAQNPAPSPVVAVSTGSVDRSPSPASEDAAAAASNAPEVVRSDARARVAAHSRRIARAKRVRRLLGRRARPKPPGSEVDVFFSSLFPKK